MTIHPSAFIAEGAKILGDVIIGENSSLWFNAVLRADEGPAPKFHQNPAKEKDGGCQL